MKPNSPFLREVLLVGSVGLKDSEEVFRTVGPLLGARMKRIPDGETGQRTSWVSRLRFVLESNPSFEDDPQEVAAGGRITHPTEGTRTWEGSGVIARGAPPPPRLRLKAGVRPEDIGVGRLGYPEAAIESYRSFCALRDQGIVPGHLRFQVSLPTTAAFLNAHLVYGHHATVEPVYRGRLFREVDEICEAIRHEDLAIQWDVSTEMGQWEGVRHAYFPDVKAGVIERLAVHCNRVPRDVELGVHLCYGSYGGRHWKEPESTANMVEVHNRLIEGLDRPLAYIHMPVPKGRKDEAYFAPLRGLKLRRETKLFLGLVHDSDGVEGTRARIAVAAKYASDFGIAAECGFGRRPPQTIPDLLRAHSEV
ncbi:MAG: hypothetical protein E6H49_03180 [Betaproteobacteria bacterium]|nr:MAG: hypothetical protein E6H49_03180 [Betaproteobacteria bacterium]